MATAGDERSPCESHGYSKKARKRPFRPEINEELQNVSQEAERNNSSGVPDEGGNYASVSVTVGKSDLEQILKQMTFTRPEIQHLTALMHSRICDDEVVERDATTIENLSGDLLSNIFIRFFAKQLAQMRSVSKSWNDLLSQSSFIKSHLQHSIHNNDRVLLVFYNNLFFSSDYIPFTAHSCQSLHHELINFIKLPLVNPESGHNPGMFRVIGSVNGLICSRYGDDVIHIWNPSLPAVSTAPPHSNSMPSGGTSLRFGYDSKTDDYKIVKLTGLTGTVSSYVVKEWLRVEVYSMRKGSWKFIAQSFPSHLKGLLQTDHVCVDGHGGHLHWPGFISEKFEFETIVAFDLGSETFHEIPLPDSLLDGKRYNKIGILDGKLCVVSRGAVYEVWVMGEYGVADSWVKHHVVLPSFDNECFVGFTSRDEFLSEDYDLRLVLYNTSTILGRFGSGEATADKVVEYVDSLVWVEPAMR